MKIEILCGMIGSSKSTYAKAQAIDGAMIVCHDDLLRMIHGEHRYSWHFRNLYQQMEESLVDDAIWNGLDVVIDRTHLTAKSRERWFEFVAEKRFKHRAMSSNYDKLEIVAVVFPFESPKVHAERRFLADPRGMSQEAWLDVAKKHFDQAVDTPIKEDEGFTRIEWKEFVDGKFRESSREVVMSRVESAKEVRWNRMLDEVDRIEGRRRREAAQENVGVKGAVPSPVKGRPVKPKPIPVAPELKNSFDLESLRESLANLARSISNPDTKS